MDIYCHGTDNLSSVLTSYAHHNSVTVWDKENLSVVFDADREIPTWGWTDNAGNEVYRVSSIIRWPEGWDFLVCIGDLWLFFLPIIGKIEILKKNILYLMLYDGQHRHSWIMVWNSLLKLDSRMYGAPVCQM